VKKGKRRKERYEKRKDKEKVGKRLTRRVEK
jgi:hypothetical protein